MLQGLALVLAAGRSLLLQNSQTAQVTLGSSKPPLLLVSPGNDLFLGQKPLYQLQRVDETWGGQGRAGLSPELCGGPADKAAGGTWWWHGAPQSPKSHEPPRAQAPGRAFCCQCLCSGAWGMLWLGNLTWNCSLGARRLLWGGGLYLGLLGCREWRREKGVVGVRPGRSHFCSTHGQVETGRGTCMGSASP